MNKCKFDKKGICIFKLSCSYQDGDKCNRFERFDIPIHDKAVMIKAITDIKNMLKEA